MQPREITINNVQYRIRRRGFDSQCELQRIALKKGLMPNDVIVGSGTQVFDMGLQKWRSMNHEDIEAMEDADGWELFNKVSKLNKRKLVTEKDFQESSESSKSQK